jgi:FO synthase
VLRAIDSDGFARIDDWSPGLDTAIPKIMDNSGISDPDIAVPIAKIHAGGHPDTDDIVRLFRARDADFHAVCRAADDLRRTVRGADITYVVTRNINYTNICGYACRFCAFSKGRRSEAHGGAPYLLTLDEIGRRAREAWERGATEVCMQGGIHPDFTGDTYLAICDAVKRAAPGIHIHAFSPLEIAQGAATLGLSVPAFLARLRDAGLGSLPGTAAEVLDDDVRATLCPDKLTTAQWLDVVEAAHGTGLRTTATIMFGHIDGPASWARHLLAIRDLQARTGGFTEFVPLPFVHMEAPIYRRGLARRGPTFREAVLMHAVARLVLHPLIADIQTSWVKMGAEGARACLEAGANDLGGTLMNESITRAAGTVHGQEFAPAAMETLIEGMGRGARQRTTLYGPVPDERRHASFAAGPLAVPVETGVARRKAPAIA